MPLVKEPHFCQPPIWPWMYRLDTVWQCPRCKTNFRIDKVSGFGHYSWEKKKRWVSIQA